GPAISAVETGIIYLGPLEAIAYEERIVAVDLMIHLDVKGIAVLHADRCFLVVSAESRKSGRGYETQYFFRDGTDPIWWNDVAGKGLAARSIGITRARIV